MHTRRWMPVILALAAATLSSTRAHADVIDYNPITTEAPTILTPDELTKYDHLRVVGGRPTVNSTGSPSGQYVLVRVAGVYKILDTRAETLTDLNLAGATLIGALYWTGPNVAVAYGSAAQAPAKVTLDFAAGTVTSAPIPIPTIPGKNIGLIGRLIQTADGKLSVLGYTVTASTQLKRIEAPSFDGRSAEERAELGQAGPAAMVAQGDESIIAIGLDDGHVTTIGTVPANDDLYGAATSVGVRPGSNTASYVLAEVIPWTGIVVKGRASRGGYMPASYFNTRENMGLVKESENRWLTGRSLHLTDLSTGADVKVVANGSRPGGMFSTTFWTADGKHLVVPSAIPSVLKGRANPIYEYNAGMELRLFAPDGTFERDWRVPGLDSTGTSYVALTDSVILVATPENMTRSVYQVDLAQPDKAPLKLYDGADQVTLFNYALAGDKIVAVRGDVTTPGDLYIGDLGKPNSQLRALSNVNPSLSQVSNIKFQPVSYTTSSGFKVTGVYVYPGSWSYPPPKPMPVVVWQEGGPGPQMLNRWSVSAESPYSMLPNYGIPVFMVNGAGRNTNSADFYSSMVDGKNFGQRDVQDVKEGIQALIDQRVVDPNAVGVTGCSYGGYFTLQSITTYPDFYKAANAQCSLNDIMYEFNFGWSPFPAYWIGESASADPLEYIKDSPTYNASKIRTPLLLFQGTDDFLPFEHITNIHDQVVANGVPARFLRAYKRGHGFGSVQGDPNGDAGLRSQRYAIQLQIDWFRKYLGVKTSPTFAQLTKLLLPQPIDPGVQP